eukprot:232269-Pyramimonas_sp.AAC.1
MEIRLVRLRLCVILCTGLCGVGVKQSRCQWAPLGSLLWSRAFAGSLIEAGPIGAPSTRNHGSKNTPNINISNGPKEA